MHAPAGYCAKQHSQLELVCSQRLLNQGTLTYPPTPRPASDPATGEEAAEDDQSRTGATYIGELVHGVREGHGKYVWPPVRAAGPAAGAGEPDASSVPGACYEGGYVAGARHGQGTMTYPGSARYEGADPRPAWRLVVSRHSPRLHAALPGHSAWQGRALETWLGSLMLEGKLHGKESAVSQVGC